jgi:hypothetical protein
VRIICPQSSSASPLHRRMSWILALDTVPRPARAVGRAKALRYDAFEPELAGVTKQDVAGSSMQSVHQTSTLAHQPLPATVHQHGSSA